MKKLKQNAYSLSIMIFGMAIVIFMMANSKNQDHEKVLNGLETLNAIIHDDIENIPEAELKKLRGECLKKKDNLSSQQQVFCRRVGTHYE